MKLSTRAGSAAVGLYGIGLLIVFVPRIPAAEPVGVAALVFSAALGSVAATKGARWWWGVPAIVFLTFAFGFWLGFTAR